MTKAVQDRANALLEAGLAGVRRVPLARARATATTGTYDFLDAYVSDLSSAIDMAAVAACGAHIGADPLGGASVAYWGAIGERYGLDLTVVNPEVDPTWRFMTLDWDGKIRMDCSSPYAMASLVRRRDEFALATGNDADADRHGIVTPEGLMNPNHFLAVAIEYLFASRAGWPAGAAVGKTLVSSSMIDRVAAGLGRRLLEVPVGFKWFVAGLLDGTVGFGGEESAGASFLRRDGSVWTTDKDGILLCLLASEILARDGELAERALPGPHRPFWCSRLRPRRRAGHPGGKSRAGRPAPRGRHRHRAGGRAHHGQADDGPRQRRPHRRAQGGDRLGLVRGPAFGDRGRLQDLRRVLPGAGAPGPHPGRGAGRRRQCPTKLVAGALKGSSPYSVSNNGAPALRAGHRGRGDHARRQDNALEPA